MDPLALNGKTTLTLVLDRTSSMGGVIEIIKKFLAKYVIRRIMEGQDNIQQLGLVTVDDHYPVGFHYEGYDIRGPYDSYGITDNLEEFMYWLHQVKLGHGGDFAEAFACGLHAAIKLDPEASIWVITDAVYHGTYYSNYPNGCPCGLPMPQHPVNVLFLEEMTESYTPAAKRNAKVSELWERLGYAVLSVPKDDLKLFLVPDDADKPAEREMIYD